MFTPDGKINLKYPSETTAVLRLNGQQNAAVSEGEEGRGRFGEREKERERERERERQTVREKHDSTYIPLRERIQWKMTKEPLCGSFCSTLKY